MSLMYFQTESEARAAVTADGGDPQYNVCWVFSPPNPKSWMARLGSDREYPPPVELTQRQITARLTQQEKESIAAAWVAGNSVLAQCLVLAPTDSDPSFLAESAGCGMHSAHAGAYQDRSSAGEEKLYCITSNGTQHIPAGAVRQFLVGWGARRIDQ